MRRPRLLRFFPFELRLLRVMRNSEGVETCNSHMFAFCDARALRTLRSHARLKKWPTNRGKTPESRESF